LVVRVYMKSVTIMGWQH